MKILNLIVVGLLVAFGANLHLFAQGWGCTNLGCKKISFMYSPAAGGDPAQCVLFPNSTGRYVRNNSGHQGDSPCDLGGSQTVLVNLINCAQCTHTNQSYAFEGSPAIDGEEASFGRYGCKPDGGACQ